jgi:hypothetical protein
VPPSSQAHFPALPRILKFRRGILGVGRELPADCGSFRAGIQPIGQVDMHGD